MRNTIIMVVLKIVAQHLNVGDTTTDFLTALLSEPCQKR